MYYSHHQKLDDKCYFLSDANSYPIMSKFLECLYPVSPGAVHCLDRLSKYIEIVGLRGDF